MSIVRHAAVAAAVSASAVAVAYLSPGVEPAGWPSTCIVGQSAWDYDGASHVWTDEASGRIIGTSASEDSCIEVAS